MPVDIIALPEFILNKNLRIIISCAQCGEFIFFFIIINVFLFNYDNNGSLKDNML